MMTLTKAKLTTNKTQIRELTKKWIEIWSPQDSSFTGKGLEQIFANDKILVLENFDDRVEVLQSLQEYLDIWKHVMQNFPYWETQLEKDLEISIEGNLAFTTFSVTGIGKSKDEQIVKTRQYVNHTWKLINHEWRLVSSLTFQLPVNKSNSTNFATIKSGVNPNLIKPTLIAS